MHTKNSHVAASAGSTWAAGATLLAAALWLAAANSAFAQPAPSVGTNLVDISRLKGNETDPSIAINTLNPSNMFVVSATDGTSMGLFVAFSTNMGATWTTNVIATNSGTNLIPAAGPYSEPSVAWDTNGNLFLAYLPGVYEGVAVALSTNGGQTFTAFTNLSPLDATDQPRITTPPSGAGAGSVWVMYKDYTTYNTPLQVQGMGSNGVFGPVEAVPGSDVGGFADIAVGPMGEVMVAFQDDLDGMLPVANIWASVQTNAVTNGVINTNWVVSTNGVISTNRFAAPQLVASDAAPGLTYIAAAPTGIGINAAPGLAFDWDNEDTNYDSAYLIYTAYSTNDNLIINFCSSTNEGNTWNGETNVDDDALTGFNGFFNDHFLPRIAVDPTTGVISCAWYDCRNDQGASSTPIINTTNASFTFTNMVISNINITSPNGSIYSYTTNDLSNGAGTNWLVTIIGTNIAGIQMKSDTTANIYVYGAGATNLDLAVSGDSTNATGTNAQVTVEIEDVFTDAYTTGAPDQEAIAYFTLSYDGGRTFLANDALISPNSIINPPATGVASSVANSGSLTGWGHYTGLAAWEGNFFPVWADNSDYLGSNPAGAGKSFDLYMLSTSNGSGLTLPIANLSIWVTSSPNPVLSAGVLVYTVIVSNKGPQTARPLTVTNLLSTNVTLNPNGVTPALGGSYSLLQTTNGEMVILTFPNGLAANKSLTNTIRVTASTSAIVVNVATVYADLKDLYPTNTTNVYSIVVEGQDLVMGMTTSETNLLIGDTVVDTITVTNLGPAANGPVLIEDFFSPNWTNFNVQLQSSWSLTNYVTNIGGVVTTNPLVVIDLGLMKTNQPATVIITAEPTGVSSFQSQFVTVTSQDVNTNPYNHSAEFYYFVNDEDLGIGLSTPASVDDLVPFTYTMSVTNFGLSYTGLITVTNTLAANLQPLSATQSQGTNSITNNQVIYTLGTLGPGQIATLAASAQAVGPPPYAAIIAQVTSTDFDTNLANNTVTNLLTVYGEDLGLALLTPPSVDLGVPFTYTMSVSNAGPSYTGLITVTNTLATNLQPLSATQSQGTNSITNYQVIYSLGTLGVGQVATLTVSALALGLPTSAAISAYVSSTVFDTNLANNGATNLLTVNGEDLSITVSASPTTVQVSQMVTYTEHVTNLGQSTNGIVWVTNTLSSNLGSISVLQPTSNYTASGNVVIFNLGTLNAGQTVPITLTATALSAGKGTNSAGVGSADFDTNLANNTANTVVTLIAALPMISNLTVAAFSSSAFIMWDTGFPTTAQVQYGLTTNYGTYSPAVTTAALQHIVLLPGLAQGSNYDFEVLAWEGTRLYTTNSSFTTANALILGTQDASYRGVWTTGSVAPGAYTNGYYQTAATTTNNPTAWAIYTPSIPVAGLYTVSIWHPQNSAFTTNAQIFIAGLTNQLYVTIDETQNGGQWQTLATNVYFAAGTNGNVTIYNDTGESDKTIVANAMMWVYDTAQDYSVNGSVPAWWANYYFGTNVNGYVNGANISPSGYSYYAAYVLGLDPTVSTSFLNFTVAPGASNTVSVSFTPCQGGRAYELQTAAALSAPVWATLTNGYTANTNGSGTFTVKQTGAANAFYRLSAQIIVP